MEMITSNKRLGIVEIRFRYGEATSEKALQKFCRLRSNKALIQWFQERYKEEAIIKYYDCSKASDDTLSIIDGYFNAFRRG